ncbi:N-acetylglucosamine kinase [Lentibacillus sp. CBA3610]|uniref:N-acetylglucosamine kinase n=1 Tax=Lentibacillus sp. CBA3610 TaxID=2518176 RepID=UPI0015963956|nr:BadF/BadG/BcrA/BcrD ATPase family protein [Lentibacillus sp. CBA3610]QKY69990.1 ATPase [Lentibacillus sp. CBA3610]
MDYILGVDGGNSKTYAVIVNSNGDRLGQGISGNGNHQGTGVDKFLENMQSAVNQALNEARLQPSEISFAQFGLAGADREKDIQLLRNALATLPFKDWDLAPDTLEGLRAGSRTNIGVVLVCGAGTNAAGRNSIGDTVQTGGFGYRFGDGAGGGFIALEAFRAAVRAWELRGPQTLLTEMLPASVGFQRMKDMYHYYLDHLHEEFPLTFTLTVHQAADRGDAEAINILKKVGWELGLAANSVIKRLGNFEIEPIPIVLVGSVLQEGKNPYLLNTLEETVKNENPASEFINLEMEPVYGAILLAMDHLNIKANDDILTKFSSYGGY